MPLEKNPRMARVLARNNVRFLKNAYRPKRYIFEISYGCSDKIKHEQNTIKRRTLFRLLTNNTIPYHVIIHIHVILSGVLLDEGEKNEVEGSHAVNQRDCFVESPSLSMTDHAGRVILLAMT